MAGRFITLEGIDGAGKSTHLQALADGFRQRGHEVLVTREPGGTELAEAIRELVLHRPMDAMTEVLMVFAARRDHLVHQIEPALRADMVVLCDRFTDATFAYQGGGRGFDLSVLRQLEQWVQQGRQPDLTLWFDLAPALAAQRRQAARSPDRFEAQDEAFFERVRAGYEARQAAEPGRFAVVDASLPAARVWDALASTMEQRGWW